MEIGWLLDQRASVVAIGLYDSPLHITAHNSGRFGGTIRMVAFLRWAASIGKGVLNGIAKFVVFLVLVTVIVVVIALFQGDGLPRNMVLTLDLRNPIADSSNV